LPAVISLWLASLDSPQQVIGLASGLGNGLSGLAWSASLDLEDTVLLSNSLRSTSKWLASFQKQPQCEHHYLYTRICCLTSQKNVEKNFLSSVVLTFAFFVYSSFSLPLRSVFTESFVELTDYLVVCQFLQ
jgi:hypothetical protein